MGIAVFSNRGNCIPCVEKASKAHSRHYSLTDNNFSISHFRLCNARAGNGSAVRLGSKNEEAKGAVQTGEG